jgi:alpha/beta superfamily hydrolase
MAIASEPKQLVIVEGAGHFFEGHLKEMQAAISDWTARVFHLHAPKNVEAS